MIKYQYVHIMLMFYSWINIIGKLPRFSTAITLAAADQDLLQHPSILRVGGEHQPIPH
jgi:hypothetical protein